MNSSTNFQTLDWGIVAAYISISLVIGLLVKRYSRNMTSFLGAGRQVGTWLGIATMTGTEMGLITVMYNAQKGFNDGFAAFHIGVLAGLVTLLVGLTGLIVVPLRQFEVLTIPEFYERRFNKKVRVAGGVILTLAGVLNMGLFLQVGSKFVVGVTGLPPGGTELAVVMTILLVLVLIYTVLGGMVSVVITDYIQFVVLAFGLIVTTILAVRNLGWQEIVTTVLEKKGESGVNPLAEGNFGVEYVSFMAVMGLVSCAVWPTAVARALAMKSPQAVRWQYTWSSLSFAIRFLIPAFWGICAFVYFSKQPESLEQFAEIKSSGIYEMPVFLSQLLPTGLLGLVTAAMLAAFMSTHDSYLLCWSSVITQDVLAPLSAQTWSPEKRIRVTRWLIFLIGLFIWAWGVLYKGSDDIWDYMSITGAIYFTGAIPVLIGGIYWRQASSTGALTALIAGGSSILGMEPLRKSLNRWMVSMHTSECVVEAENIFSAPKVGICCIAISTLAFVLVSKMFPDPPREITMTEKPQ